MNVPYSWLRELVDLDIPARELAQKLTMAGLEAEKITDIGADWNNVFVGEVVSVTQHPDADRLVLADVSAGEHRLTVVTGAPNIAPGQRVALALAGARLIDAYSDEPGKMKTLKPGKIRGIMSEGMVCSEKELGLSDEHEGILVLPDDAPVGVELGAYLGDSVIEFEITPNLVHAFSMRGIAGEAAAVTAREMREPTYADLPASRRQDNLVTIDSPELCPRYIGVIIDGVHVEPSPTWMASRLTAAGIRPVNNLVDITNYVMLEIGQPLHAFDLRNIAGERIIVRNARDGEAMETLDHTRRTLSSADLLITDAEKPVAIAGVMGGVNSEVLDDTSSILLESANFDMVAVRGTARSLKLRTDASARFERGLDPNLADVAARRALQLIVDVCPGATVRAWDDEYPMPVESWSVSLPVAQVFRVLGMTIPEADMVSALERLRFAPEITNETLTVSVPTSRPDVTIPEDVIEEIARIVGYAELPSTLIEGETPEVERDPEFRAQQIARQTLSAAGGFEGRSYVTSTEFDASRWATLAGPAISEPVRLVNPMNAAQPALRTSLVPRLLTAAAENLKHESSVRLFEIGHVFLPTSPDHLPDEPNYVAIVAAGSRASFDRFTPRQSVADQLDFFDVKGDVALLLNRLGVSDETWEASEHDALHPGRTASVFISGQRVGTVAELRPDVANEIGITDTRVAIAELNLSLVRELAGAATPPVVKVDHFLPVEQDFAIVVDRETPATSVEDALRKNAGNLLTDITLFDIFEGSQIGEGKKSLAYRLRFTAPDRALTDAELEKQRKKIEKGVKALVGGAIRS